MPTKGYAHGCSMDVVDSLDKVHSLTHCTTHLLTMDMLWWCICLKRAMREAGPRHDSLYHTTRDGGHAPPKNTYGGDKSKTISDIMDGGKTQNNSGADGIFWYMMHTKSDRLNTHAGAVRLETATLET